MRISLTALTDQGPRDIVVNGDSDMTVASVALSLIRAFTVPDLADRLVEAARSPQPPALWTDGRMLDPNAEAARVLRDGAVVTVEPRTAAATVLAEPTGLVEIRVVGGAAAGGVHRLGIGTTTLGAGPDA